MRWPLREDSPRVLKYFLRYFYTLDLVGKGSWKKTRSWELLSWNVRAGVRKFLMTYYCIQSFPTWIGTIQLKWKLYNFKLSNFFDLEGGIHVVGKGSWKERFKLESL